MQHHAQVVAALGRVGQFGQGAGAKKGFGTALAAARAQRPVDLQNAVANFTGHALHAGKQAVVEHNARAHTGAAGHKDQRVFGIALGKFVFAQGSGVGFVLHMHGHRWHAGLGQCVGNQGHKVHIAPAQVGRKTQHAGGFVKGTGQAHAYARQLHTALHQLRMGACHQAGRLAAHLVGLGAHQGLLQRAQHLAGERHTHHAQRLHRHFHTNHAAAAAVDLQRGGGAAQALGCGHIGLGEPTFVNQLAHQQAHGGLGQSTLLGQLGAGQPALAAQQPQQHAAVDAFD